MFIIARPGIKVPKEGQPRQYITDSEAVEVPESHYYLKQVADGDLLYPPSTSAAFAESVKKPPTEQS